MHTITVADLLARGERRLRESPHPERARQDAERLLLGSLAENKAWLIAHADECVSPDEADAYIELVDRRYRGEPMQYVEGCAEFYGLNFQVTPDVLIPRPETEHLVEKTIELAAGFTHPRIVDIGTGSGAIAIALAHALSKAIVTATDQSPVALAVAERNAARNGVADRIRFLTGDLLAPIAQEQFEIVVSNPPYVPDSDRDSLSVEVRDYEPAQALFAGEDGLAIYRRLIPAAFRALAPDGFVVLEIGYGQQAGVRPLLEDAGFTHIAFTADLKGIPRVASAQRDS